MKTMRLVVLAQQDSFPGVCSPAYGGFEQIDCVVPRRAKRGTWKEDVQRTLCSRSMSMWCSQSACECQRRCAFRSGHLDHPDLWSTTLFNLGFAWHDVVGLLEGSAGRDSHCGGAFVRCRCMAKWLSDP